LSITVLIRHRQPVASSLLRKSPQLDYARLDPYIPRERKRSASNGIPVRFDGGAFIRRTFIEPLRTINQGA